MRSRNVALSVIVGCGCLAAASVTAVGAAPAPPTLALVATYDTGLGADGAEIISVRSSDGLAVLTNIAGNVDVIDLSNPTAPARLLRVPIDTTNGTPNSVAIHPDDDYFLVVTGRAGAIGSVYAHRLSDGALLAQAPLGIQPDSIAISPGGRYAVVANEAEGTAVGANGGAGSLTLIDLEDFEVDDDADDEADDDDELVLEVKPISLPTLTGTAGFSTGRTDDLARLAIDNSPATLEPESVAFDRDELYAYVSMQENNAVARLDLRNGQLRFFGLGTTTHPADQIVDGAYLPTSFTALREPDGIGVLGSGLYFVTADEGDTRNSAGGSGVRGGRTVSVFDARTGAVIADTGSQLDDAANAAGRYPDARSSRGGSEPEVLDVTRSRGRELIAVGLERANAVALIDVSNPALPTVLDLEPVGSNPEGIKFLERQGRLYVVSANEVSGTVSVLAVS